MNYMIILNQKAFMLRFITRFLRIYGNVMSLPFYNGMSDDEIDYVIEAVNAFDEIPKKLDYSVSVWKSFSFSLHNRQTNLMYIFTKYCKTRR